MDLHQIQITYQAGEDRILCRTSFKAEDGNLQEIRAWLTRRLVRKLWPGIINAMATKITMDKPQAAHASADIVSMEHQACVDGIKGSGNFTNAYQNDIQAYPLERFSSSCKGTTLAIAGHGLHETVFD